MESLKNQKSVFKSLDQKEMNELQGGRPIILHHDCIMTNGDAASVDIYGYNFFERVFGGHSRTETHHEDYDNPSNCK